MVYLIREKVFSFGDKFTIKDIHGNDVYQVEGQVFSFGNKLRLYSMDGYEVAYIEQKLFKFLPEYHIYMNGNDVALVKKEFGFFTQRINIDSDFGNFEIEGDIFAHSFEVYKNGQPVAGISKAVFSFGDTYEVDISDFENQPFILALVIAVDQIFHDDKKR